MILPHHAGATTTTPFDGGLALVPIALVAVTVQVTVEPTSAKAMGYVWRVGPTIGVPSLTH
jgi:hypothetical protein